MFVERFRFIFSFLRRKNNYVFQFWNSKFIYSLLPDTVKFFFACRLPYSLNSPMWHSRKRGSPLYDVPWKGVLTRGFWKDHVEIHHEIIGSLQLPLGQIVFRSQDTQEGRPWERGGSSFTILRHVYTCNFSSSVAGWERVDELYDVYSEHLVVHIRRRKSHKNSQEFATKLGNCALKRDLESTDTVQYMNWGVLTLPA